MKYSGIGGQAVIEGVMMKNGGEYAVAVRRADGGIAVKKEPCKRVWNWYKFTGVPVFRGIVAFVESTVIGMNVMNYSASLLEEEDAGAAKECSAAKERSDAKECGDSKKRSGTSDNLVMGLVLALSIIMAIAIFVIVPFLVSESLRKVVRMPQLRGLIEGMIRVTLFITYVGLISRIEDIRRIFMYHGAEHKSINCIENGYDLTVENVRRQTIHHKRCGTSFLLVVMIVSILFFMFIVVSSMWLRMLLRILLIPLIAGVSYELIRYAGSHENIVSRMLSKPGQWLQKLTTIEPDDAMIEVAMASVNAVFDWKKFVLEVREEDKARPEKTAAMTGDITKISILENPLPASEPKFPASEPKFPAPEPKFPAPEPKFPAPEPKVPGTLDLEAEEDAILNALDRFFEAPK